MNIAEKFKLDPYYWHFMHDSNNMDNLATYVLIELDTGYVASYTEKLDNIDAYNAKPAYVKRILHHLQKIIQEKNNRDCDPYKIYPDYQ